MLVTIRRALLSVSDKTGLVDFARALSRRNVELLSTGGTARALRDAGLAVIDVSAYTGFPEIMDGRVKTLHPRVHGGLLGRRGVDDAVMAKHDIPPIDLLVVNLYPFAQTVAKPDCTYADAIENIDIGGPAMVRAASKNHESVTVVVDPADYGQVLGELEAKPGRDIHVGEVVTVRLGALTRTLKVVGLPRTRVAAKQLPEFIQDLTPPAEYERARQAGIEHLLARQRGEGRPTKKDRREMGRLFGFE